MSHIHYYNAILKGVPMCAVQNAVAHLFNQPITSLLIELHWLPGAVHIKSVLRILTYRATSWICSSLLDQACASPMNSVREHRPAKPSVQAWKSRLLSDHVNQWRNDLPSSIRSGRNYLFLPKVLKDPLLRAPSSVTAFKFLLLTLHYFSLVYTPIHFLYIAE